MYFILIDLNYLLVNFLNQTYQACSLYFKTMIESRILMSEACNELSETERLKNKPKSSENLCLLIANMILSAFFLRVF